jgi:hypothetical protein
MNVFSPEYVASEPRPCPHGGLGFVEQCFPPSIFLSNRDKRKQRDFPPYSMLFRLSHVSKLKVESCVISDPQSTSWNFELERKGPRFAEDSIGEPHFDQTKTINLEDLV